jgi:hypothetical protein
MSMFSRKLSEVSPELPRKWQPARPASARVKRGDKVAEARSRGHSLGSVPHYVNFELERTLS